MLELNIVFIKNELVFFIALPFHHAYKYVHDFMPRQYSIYKYSFPILALCQSNIEPKWFDFFVCYKQKNLQVLVNSKLVLYGVESKLQLELFIWGSWMMQATADAATKSLLFFSLLNRRTQRSPLLCFWLRLPYKKPHFEPFWIASLIDLQGWKLQFLPP